MDGSAKPGEYENAACMQRISDEPAAGVKGDSPLSRCRGETSCAGRGQGPAQLSDGNRHLVLGITCRFHASTGSIRQGPNVNLKKGDDLHKQLEDDKTQRKSRKTWDL